MHVAVSTWTAMGDRLDCLRGRPDVRYIIMCDVRQAKNLCAVCRQQRSSYIISSMVSIDSVSGSESLGHTKRLIWAIIIFIYNKGLLLFMLPISLSIIKYPWWCLYITWWWLYIMFVYNADLQTNILKTTLLFSIWFSEDQHKSGLVVFNMFVWRSASAVKALVYIYIWWSAVVQW